MNWFKMGWFKSSEREEMQERIKQLELDNAKLEGKREILNEVQEELNKIVKDSNEKVYRSLRQIGDTTIVILKDGTPLTGGAGLYDKIKESQSEEDIISLFTAVEVKNEPEFESKEERKLVKDNWEVLRKNTNFVIKDDRVFFIGISLPLPAIVAASFIEILEKIEAHHLEINFNPCKGLEDEDRFIEDKLQEEFEALLMFWLKLAVNPIEQSREQLLGFCKKNDVKITKTGNLVLYRKIVTINQFDKSLLEFISQQYFKIKRWKKSPNNYYVISKEEYVDTAEDDGVDYEEDNDEEDYWDEPVPVRVKQTVHSLVEAGKQYDSEGTLQGNLEDLYLELPNMQENKYTSQHNKGKYEIKVGSIYQIEEDELNTESDVCHGGGLHAANVNYNYGGYGDTPVVVLVNPSKALTVPHSDMGKLRTTEMFIACVNDQPLGVHYDDYLLSDDIYNQHTIAELEEALRTKNFSKLCIQEEVPEINLSDLASITSILKSRVVKI